MEDTKWYGIEEYDYGDEIFFGGRGCGLIAVGEWYAGGTKKSPDKWAKLQAEARLIAASADLLEALQEVVDAADGDGWKQIDPLFTKQRAAIAKARGEK